MLRHDRSQRAGAACEGNGRFDAFNAKTGERLWCFNLGAGVNAPPITYAVDGQRYVAVAAGGNYQIDFPRGGAIPIFKLSKHDRAPPVSISITDRAGGADFRKRISQPA